MEKFVSYTIDEKECMAKEGTMLVSAAKDNGYFIPTLCNMEGLTPHGACRICTVKINGKFMAACTTPVSANMKVENNTEEIEAIRKTILELMFVEGNHFCPSCEKSGNCELQALAYRSKMVVADFEYQFVNRPVNSSSPKLLLDHNRCILCERCIRGLRDKNGKNRFAFKKRGKRVEINIEKDFAESMNEEEAQKAMDICPVGAIIHKGKGFSIPIGMRKFDINPTENELEK